MEGIYIDQYGDLINNIVLNKQLQELAQKNIFT